MKMKYPLPGSLTVYLDVTFVGEWQLGEYLGHWDLNHGALAA